MSVSKETGAEAALRAASGSHRGAAAIATAVVAALIAAGGCGSEGGSGGGSGGADGGSAGTAGASTGGASGTAGGAGTGTGGTAASAGSGGTSGTAGAAGTTTVQWVEVGQVLSCRVERAANVDELAPAFAWEPCGDGCERAEPDVARWFAPGTAKPRMRAGGCITDDGQSSLFGFKFYAGYQAEHEVAVATDSDGRVVHALRVQSTGEKRCGFGFNSTWSPALAVHVNEVERRSTGVEVLETAMLYVDTSKSDDVSVFETGGLFSIGIPQDLFHGLGDRAWVGQLAIANEIFGIDLETGATSILAAQGPDVVARRWPDSTGSHFLFTESRETPNGVRAGIGITTADGPARNWLTLQDAGVGTPRFAHTHVGFLRGTSPASDRTYDSFEIWSTPWSSDSSKLQPWKIADYPVPSAHRIDRTSSAAGGHGYYLLADPVEDANEAGYTVWNLETGASRHYDGDADRDFYWALGVTRQHAYVMLHEPPANHGAALERRALGF